MRAGIIITKLIIEMESESVRLSTEAAEHLWDGKQDST